jgi:carbonic anhydrase
MSTVLKEPQLLEQGYEILNLVVVDENYSTAAEEVNSEHDEVVNQLKNKFKDFKTHKFLAEPELFNKLAKQQEPKVMLIACIDSRCNPTMLLGLEPGEAFVVRNVGALVHPFHEQHSEHENGIGAATQFAVGVMNVEHIVVVGHSSCGGIKALMSRDDFTTDLIGGWVKIALPAKKKAHLHSHHGELAHHEQMSFAEKETVNVSLKNLLTYPFIEERVKDGRLQIHGMHYDLTEGKLTCWDIAPCK